MIMKFVEGDLFESNAEALVNTVNTIGVMGKGVALQFRERFPENYALYASACKKGDITVGKMFITATNSMMNPKWIINFPTKKHWMHKSSYDYINSGLEDLIQHTTKLGIKSIAIPPLGSGQGGLDWAKVKNILVEKLEGLQMDIMVYEPSSKGKTTSYQSNINLTKPRALILALIDTYRKLGFDTTLLEVQKLAYFLQRIGQSDLRLNYKKYHYGPYAHNLQHLLHKLENDYILTDKSILDSKPLDIIAFNSKRLEEINDFIERKCSAEEKSRLEKVKELMDGYESPFGLELLATLDWIIKEECKSILPNPEVLQEKLKEWSDRKFSSFSISHIATALNRLAEFKTELAYN